MALLAAGALFAGGVAPALAEQTDTGAVPNVVIDAAAQSPEDALGNLAAQYGFTIERSGQRAEADVITGHFEGPLDDVVSRVLANENHMIRHESGQPGRIAKILLLGQPSQTATAAAATQTQVMPVAIATPEPVAPQPVPVAPKSVAAPPAAPHAAPVVQQTRQVRTSFRSRRGNRAAN